MDRLIVYAKFWAMDVNRFKQTLREIGAKFEHAFATSDRYFYIKAENETRKYLRIRQRDKVGELTYTNVFSDNHIKIWSTEIKEPDIMEEILTNLGYSIDIVVNKKRESFKYKDSKIVFDYVKNLGDFIEIQAPDEIALRRILSDIEMDKKCHIVGKGYPDMLKEKKSGNFEYPSFIHFCA